MSLMKLLICFIYSEICSIQFHGDIKELPWLIKESPEKIYLTPGEKLILDCQTEVNANYTWYYNGEEVNWIVLDISEDEEDGFQWTSRQNPESGVYWCAASVGNYTVFSNPTKVIVGKHKIQPDRSHYLVKIAGSQWSQLDCPEAKGIPQTDVKWFISTEQGERSEVKENRTMIMDDDGNLHVANLFRAGHAELVLWFRCIVHYPGVDSIVRGMEFTVLFESYKKEIARHPKLIYHSEQLILVERGDPIVLRCYVDGYPLPNVKWYYATMSETESVKDLIKIPRGEGHLITDPTSFQHGDVQLVVPKANKIHSGLYSCAYPKPGTSDKNVPPERQFFRVQVITMPGFVLRPRNRTIPVMSSTRLTCSADKIGATIETNITWYRNGVSIEVGNTVMEVHDEYLQLNNVTRNDTAMFQCASHTKYDQRLINVFINVSGTACKFIRPMKLLEHVRINESVVIDCNVTGDPQPKIEWKFNEHLITRENDHGSFDFSEDGKLTIKRAEKKMAGIYTCTAFNMHGSIHGETRLEVLMPTLTPRAPEAYVRGPNGNRFETVPRIMYRGRRIVSVVTGKPVKLHCDMTEVGADVQVPRINWEKDGETLENMEYYHILQTTRATTLEIQEASTKDSGLYECSLMDPVFGKQSENIQLFVIGEDMLSFHLKLLEGPTWTLNCCLSTDLRQVASRQYTHDSCPLRFNLNYKKVDDNSWQNAQFACGQLCLPVPGLDQYTSYEVRVTLTAEPAQFLISHTTLVTTKLHTMTIVKVFALWGFFVLVVVVTLITVIWTMRKCNARKHRDNWKRWSDGSAYIYSKTFK